MYEMSPTTCNLCGKPVRFVDSRLVYCKSYGPIYRCTCCGAYVGCHKGTNTALGTLADADMRKLRIECHTLFDSFWNKEKDKVTMRTV